MSVSDEERQTLHLMLDALINARNSLEKIEPDKLTPGMQYREAWSRPRQDLCRQASVLVRRILGPRLHREELELLFSFDLQENASHAELLACLANSLRAFLPIFMEEGRDTHTGSDEVITQVLEDFMGIYWGDEPRFFSILPRRQGQHKRLYRLNRLRLSALDWDKYLATVGVGTRERHGLISDAYKTDWEAIRKWANAVEEQYGFRSWPPNNPEWARQEYAENPEKICEAIRRDGEAYWLERSAAGSGKQN